MARAMATRFCMPPDISLGEIFRSMVPFIVLQILALALLIAFPGIAVH